jgi:AAA domain
MKVQPAGRVSEARPKASTKSNDGKRDWYDDQFRIAMFEEDPALADAFAAVPMDLEEPSSASTRPFVDLVGLWKGGIKPEKPSIVRVSKDRCLFYAGRLNEIHSEPSLGKTNIAIFAALKILLAGGEVVYMDPEDTATGFLSRLLALGLANLPLLIEEILERVHYIHDPDAQSIKQARQFAERQKIDLVVYDGLAEGMAAEDLDEDKAKDTLKFLRQRLRPFAELGCAVVILDHVVKSRANQRWSRGSGAKIGRYDGVSYVLILVESYTPNKAGRLSLKVAKDRHGGVGAINQKIGDLVFVPNGDGTTQVDFEDVVEAPFRPTILMQKIHDFLVEHPGASKRDLRTLGSAKYIDDATKILIEEGYVRVNKAAVGGRSSHFVVKTFRERI